MANHPGAKPYELTLPKTQAEAWILPSRATSPTPFDTPPEPLSNGFDLPTLAQDDKVRGLALRDIRPRPESRRPVGHFRSLCQSFVAAFKAGKRSTALLLVLALPMLAGQSHE